MNSKNDFPAQPGQQPAGRAPVFTMQFDDEAAANPASTLEMPARPSPLPPVPAAPTTSVTANAAPAKIAVHSSAVLDSESPNSFGVISEAPGWLVSLGMHLLIVLALWTIKLESSVDDQATIISTLEDVERQIKFDTAVVDQVGSGTENLSLAASAAVATQVSQTPEKAVEQQIDDNFKAPDVPVTTEPERPAEAEMLASVDVSGTGTENTGGVEGAIDRLTFEIASSLREKKTTVVWLFDASLSLAERRNAIADRFENVYRQLDAIDADSTTAGALKTAVATFGEKSNLLTEEAVDDVRTVIPKVRAIPNDESGKENVFATLAMVIKKFQKHRSQNRNVMIFIVTDERGDDVHLLEDVLLQCRRYGIKCYVVGNASLFGREESYVTWKYPDETTEDLPVDGGPETFYPDALRLSFWGNRGPSLDRMSSGYGPYALTRLCQETGGLYFIASEGNGPKFSHAVMRNYAPDYSPIKDLDLGIKKNKAKAALVMTAVKTKADNVSMPRLAFQATSDNILREQITEAQKPAANLDYKLNEMLTMLLVGEKDREKIAEPRWRAAYDLAMGRVLAMRVRALGYNTMLAEMKALPKSFTKKGNNEWRIVASKTNNAGPVVKKLEKQAVTYLKRVIDEHPGTPWELLAQRELAQSMGWEWQEAVGDYLDLTNMDAESAKKAIQLAEEKKKAAAKAAAMPPKPRPKL